MAVNTITDAPLDQEAHEQLVADALSALAAGESGEVTAPTAVDLALEGASVAWFIAYKQNVKLDDVVR
jgi:hypothetical protein